MKGKFFDKKNNDGDDNQINQWWGSQGFNVSRYFRVLRKGEVWEVKERKGKDDGEKGRQLEPAWDAPPTMYIFYVCGECRLDAYFNQTAPLREDILQLASVTLSSQTRKVLIHRLGDEEGMEDLQTNGRFVITHQIRPSYTAQDSVYVMVWLSHTAVILFTLLKVSLN